MESNIWFGDVRVAGMAQIAGSLRVDRISGSLTHPTYALPAAHAAGAKAAAAPVASRKRRNAAATFASVIGGHR